MATVGNDSMKLSDILNEKQIIPELQAADRWEAIDELINNLVQCGTIKAESREQIAAVVKKRETSMSTGIGFGIGIPLLTGQGNILSAFGLGLREAGAIIQRLSHLL